MKIQLTAKCDFFALLNPNRLEDAPLFLLNDMQKSIDIDYNSLPAWAKSTIIKANKMRKIVVDGDLEPQAIAPKKVEEKKVEAIIEEVVEEVELAPKKKSTKKKTTKKTTKK